MRGDLPSVRLPRRIVPICVSEPMGFERPLRMASTPAMKVVATAPIPGQRIPSLPEAGRMSTGTEGDFGGDFVADMGAPSINLPRTLQHLYPARIWRPAAELPGCPPYTGVENVVETHPS